jgi:hypothetical protein
LNTNFGSKNERQNYRLGTQVGETCGRSKVNEEDEGEGI